MTIGTGATILGLANLMIGGIMLMIPILAIDAGYMDWITACLIMASATCYTAYLQVKHLGKANNIKELIINHFKGDHTYTNIYNIIIWSNFAVLVVIYFQLFCIQIQGLFDTDYQFIP